MGADMLTMRQMIDIMLFEDRTDLDGPEADRLQLLGLAEQLDDLHRRVRDELARSFSPDRTEAIDETSTGIGVSPQVAAKRAERDTKRRDQLNQLTKKQASVRASMGT